MLKVVSRLLAVLTLLQALNLPRGLAQDDPARAAVVAEQQAAEERYRRLNSAIEDLLNAQASQQKRLNALAEELRALREDLGKNNPEYASQSALRDLAQKLQEIDAKREADKKLILDELQKLLKAPAPAQSQIPVPPPADPPHSAAARIEKGYEHVVEKNQTLSLIIQAYRAQGVKVSLQDVLDANPGLKPERLKVGQKVFVPDMTK